MARPKTKCTAEGCERAHYGLGFCHLHYGRLYREGEPGRAALAAIRARNDLQPDGTKRCVQCGERKAFTAENFPISKSKAGLRAACRVCARRGTMFCQMKSRYGVTPAQREQMSRAQGGKCLVCAESFGAGKKLSPHIDHCHATGKVRGLLCLNCNALLGHARDSVAVLTSAINYLGASK